MRPRIVLGVLLLTAAAIGVVFWNWRDRAIRSARRLAAWEAQQHVDATAKILERELEFSRAQMPLPDFASLIVERTRLSAEIDDAAVLATHKDLASIVVDVPSGRFSVSDLLQVCLGPNELSYDISNGGLIITTVESAEDYGHMRTVVFPLSQHHLASARTNSEVWKELIVTTVQPENWDDVGGQGHCEAVPGALIVTHCDVAHREIDRMLHALRGLESPPSSFAPVPLYAFHNKDDDVRAQMKRSASLNVRDKSLESVLDELARAHGIPVIMNYRKLEEAGVPRDAPITTHVENVALATVLWGVLEPLELTYFVRGGSLTVTTPEDAESPENMLLTAYPVHDLIGLPRSIRGGNIGRIPIPVGHDWEALIQLIQAFVMPESWVDVGGPGSCSVAFDGWLLVSQTEDVHRKVEAVLTNLRRALAYDDHPVVLSLLDSHGRDERLWTTIERNTSLKVENQPLHEAVERLSDQLALPLIINQRAIEAAGVSIHSPVGCDLAEAPLRDQLNKLLAPLDLTVHVRDGAIVVTSFENAEENLDARAYDVRPIIDLSVGCLSYDDLIDSILSQTERSTWSDHGGPGSVCHFRGLLVVDQTEEIHGQIAQLLSSLENSSPVSTSWDVNSHHRVAAQAEEATP